MSDVFDFIASQLQGGSDEEHFISVLAPANNSGAHGIALLTLDENRLTIDVAASGLEPNQAHPFHIHGFTDDRSSQLPSIEQDADRDGFVESAEGAQVFGPVILALAEQGPPAASVATTDYPFADANGEIEFSRTFTFDLSNSQQAAIFNELSDRLSGRGLQFHGLDIPGGAGQGTGNEVNGTGGYAAALPVANGIIQELPSAISSDVVSLLRPALPDLNSFLFGPV